MDITPLVQQGSQIIQSYAGGKFRVSGEVYSSPVLVFPDRVELWDVSASDLQALCLDDFHYLLDRVSEIDVVLLGGGAVVSFLPPALRQDLKNAGLSVDLMDTGAACRTYNVLMAEGRRVVAALLPV